MDIKSLLEALDEDAVKAKIRTIIVDQGNELTCLPEAKEPLLNGDSELGSMKSVIQDKDREIEDLKMWIDKLKSLLGFEKEAKLLANDQVVQLSMQIDEKSQAMHKLEVAQESLVEDKRRLENDVAVLNQKLEFYRSNFRDDLEVLELYERLSEQTHFSLSGIFKDTSVQGLMACGIQEKNISNLWDYVKSEIVNGNNADIASVISLFNLLFKRFTLAYSMFSLQNVNSGDSFDTQCHIKHSSSTNISGPISQIMLYGYVNSKTGKVIKQSVVKL